MKFRFNLPRITLPEKPKKKEDTSEVIKYFKKGYRKGQGRVSHKLSRLKIGPIITSLIALTIGLWVFETIWSQMMVTMNTTAMGPSMELISGVGGILPIIMILGVLIVMFPLLTRVLRI